MQPQTIDEAARAAAEDYEAQMTRANRSGEGYPDLETVIAHHMRAWAKTAEVDRCSRFLPVARCQCAADGNTATITVIDEVPCVLIRADALGGE